MPSIGEDLDIIGTLLENRGTYPGDPQAYQLSSYLNNWGGITFHVAMNEQEVKALYTSSNCREIKTLWHVRSGITAPGKEILQEYRKIREPHASDCSIWVGEPCSCITARLPS